MVIAVALAAFGCVGITIILLSRRLQNDIMRGWSVVETLTLQTVVGTIGTRDNTIP